jgi:hypothetical protein
MQQSIQTGLEWLYIEREAARLLDDPDYLQEESLLPESERPPAKV